MNLCGHTHFFTCIRVKENYRLQPELWFTLMCLQKRMYPWKAYVEIQQLVIKVPQCFCLNIIPKIYSDKRNRVEFPIFAQTYKKDSWLPKTFFTDNLGHQALFAIVKQLRIRNPLQSTVTSHWSTIRSRHSFCLSWFSAVDWKSLFSEIYWALLWYTTAPYYSLFQMFAFYITEMAYDDFTASSSIGVL